jgi:hypothetical protein
MAAIMDIYLMAILNLPDYIVLVRIDQQAF